jgi:hypothetical protein
MNQTDFRRSIASSSILTPKNSLGRFKILKLESNSAFQRHIVLMTIHMQRIPDTVDHSRMWYRIGKKLISLVSWSIFIGKWLGKSSKKQWIARIIWTTALSSDVPWNNDRISCKTIPPMTSPNRLFQLFVYAMIGHAASKKCLLVLGRIYAHGHFPPGEANYRKWIFASEVEGRLSPISAITRGKTVFQPTEHLTNMSGVMKVFMRRWW